MVIARVQRRFVPFSARRCTGPVGSTPAGVPAETVCSSWQNWCAFPTVLQSRDNYDRQLALRYRVIGTRCCVFAWCLS